MIQIMMSLIESLMMISEWEQPLLHEEVDIRDDNSELHKKLVMSEKLRYKSMNEIVDNCVEIELEVMILTSL